MPVTRTLYIVVHGVGDPDPGETTRDLARGLTAARPGHEPIAVTEEQVWVPELDPEGRSQRLTRPFLVPVFRDDAHGWLLAEVNWADLSPFPVSLFGLFEGLFSLLFGLRHIAAAAASPPANYSLAQPLRRLGWWVAFLLIGPLATSNVLMLFLLASALIPDWLAPGSFAGPAGDASARFGCVLAILAGLALAGYFHRPEKYASPGGAAYSKVALAGYLHRAEEYRWVGVSLSVLSCVVLAALMTLQVTQSTSAVWSIHGLPELFDVLGGLSTKAGQSKAEYTGGVVLYAAVAMIPMVVAFLLANVLSLVAIVAFVLYAVTQYWRPNPDAFRSALVATLLPFAMLFG